MLAKQFLFFKQTVPAAMDTMRQYGVPASIALAQAILESSWGESELARQAKNYFGIKAVRGGDHVEFRSAEYIGGKRTLVMAEFAKYSSVQDSFAHHALLLARAPRYAPAMAVRRDPEKFAAQLQACGYSTNPNYASALMQLVAEFNLTQYDVEPEPPAQAGENQAPENAA